MNYKHEVLIFNNYDSIKIDYSSYHLNKQKVLYLIVSNWGYFWLLDINWKTIIPVEYLEMKDCLLWIKKDLLYNVKFKGNGKFGVINLKNEIIIQFEWDDINILTNDYFWVKKEWKWWIINKDNQIVIPIEYDWESYSSYEVDSYEWGFFKVKKWKHYWIVDIKNKTIIPFEWAKIMSCWLAGYFFVSKDKSYSSSKWWIIDSKWNMIIPFEYSNIEHIIDKYRCAEKQWINIWQRWVIDDENNIILPFTFNRIMKNNKWYYAGQFLDFSEPINNNIVYKWKIWNIVNRTELSEKYDWVWDVQDDKFDVINDGERYFINFQWDRIT